VKRLQQFSRTESLAIVKKGDLAEVAVILWQAGDFEAVHWLLSVYCDVIPCGWLHQYHLHFDETKQFSYHAAKSKSTCWRQIHSTLHRDTRDLSLKDLDMLELAIAEASNAPPKNG